MDQMKNYRQLLKELPSNKVIFAFGQFQPPTAIHELHIKAVKKLAEEHKSDYVILASKDPKEELLSEDKKIHYMNLIFPNTHIQSTNASTIIEAAKQLNKKYKNLIMITSSDLKEDYEKILNKKNKIEFFFETIEVVAAGDLNPDKNKLCESAKKGDYIKFKSGLPIVLREIDSRRLMNDIRSGFGLNPIKEEIKFIKDDLREKYFRGEIFNLGDIVESNGQQYTIVKRGSNHLLLKEESGELVSKWIKDVKEGVIQQSGTDDLDPPTINTTSKYNIAKDILRIKDFKKLSKMNQGGFKEQTLEDEKILNGMDRQPDVGHTMGDHNDNHRRRKVNYRVESVDVHDPYIDIVMQHSKNAEKAKARGNMGSYHAHMVQHHDSMGSWHNHNERPLAAEKEYKQASWHHAEMQKYPYLTENHQYASVEHTDSAKIITHGHAIKIVIPKKHHKDIKNLEHGQHHVIKDQDGNHWGVIRDNDHYQFKPHSMDTNLYSSMFCRVPVDEFHNGAAASDEKIQQESIQELSNDLLTKAGDYEKGNKRFKGIKNATFKQFTNDLKKHNHVKEDNSHYEDSQKHIALASKSLETSDMISHHGHMANHHDSLSQWHDSKGRSAAAQKHADKAEEHAEKYTKLARGVKENTDLEEAKKKKEKNRDDFKPTATEVKMSNDDNQLGDTNSHGFDAFFNEDNMSDTDIDLLINTMTDDDLFEAYEDSELALIDEETGEELENFDDNPSSQINEVLSRAERIRAKIRFAKTKSKRQTKAKLALRRTSSSETINKRARRLAVTLFKKLMLRGRPISSVGVAEKERMEKTIQKRKAVLNRVAMKLTSRVRQIEKTRLNHQKFTKGDGMNQV